MDGNGFITASEIGNAMKALGEDIPGYQIRNIIDEADKDENGKIEFNEFLRIYKTYSKKSAGSEFMNLIRRREQLEISGGTSESSAEGTRHSYSEGERVGFVDWIKTSLKDDEEFKTYLPIDSTSQEIFIKIKDGIILCKMINVAVPETVDERAITKPKSSRDLTAFRENLTLALNSARSIGCSTVNIGAEDLEKGTNHLVLSFLWQIIRLGLFAKITLSNVPEMVALLSDGESLNDLMALPPEDILLRWFNYQLEQAGCGRRVENFSDDIKDSECYFHLLRVLLKRIAPDAVDSSVIQEQNPSKRAARTLMMADSIGCKKFVRPKDVVAGDPKLNMAFVANLFNHHHCLPPLDSNDEDPKEETREERTFRNWMNSIGVTPYVNYLYTDLRNGIVLLDVFDIIEPGIVKKKVYRPPYKHNREKMEQLENCNYALEIGRGKEMNFSLVGIGGQDIYNGNETLTLAIVWQQMRAYTLALLSKLTPDGTKIEDKDIINWVNNKLLEAGKSSRITNFQDLSISSSLPVLDLVDAIKPGTVKYDMVSKGSSEEGKHRNAKYALSVARKIGAATYALPDDLVEVKPKMVLTVFACLMAANLVIGKKLRKNRKC